MQLHGCALFGTVMPSRQRVLMLLYLLDAAFVLQMCLTWSEAHGLNHSQRSIDQEILEAYLSLNTSGQMRDSTVVTVQFDMLFLRDVYAEMISTPTSDTGTTRRMRRKAMQNESLRWPNATVPYVISATFNQWENVALRQAMNDYHAYTCIRFREKLSGDDDYVNIVNGNGCLSWVGRQGGEQELTLSRHCRKKPVIIHELGHVLGLLHEHSRPDRDKYVSINSENILPNFQADFQQFNNLTVNFYGIPYDFESIMHYGQNAASANNKRVIETKNSCYQDIIGQRFSLSFRDVKLLNLIYQCSDRCRSQIQPCPGEGFIGSDCRCWCPSGSKEIAAIHCPDIECGGTLLCSGTIRSPYFTGAYPSNVNCTWMLQPSSVDGGISLEILHFSIDTRCHFVRIIDSSGEQLVLTGEIRKQPLLFIETSVKVSFTTNCSATSVGFEIAFSTVSPLAVRTCGSSLVDYGTIHSPNFPGGYPNNIRCTWTLQSLSMASWMSLEIRRFSTESCCDIVRISDASGQEVRLSGEQEPRLHFIRTPATVTFTTDATVNDIGFEIVISNASVLPENCSFGWTANGDLCYRLTKRISWAEARKECHSMNAFLVSIRNYTEHLSLSHFLYSKRERKAWIGLNDLQSERQWVWDSGEPVTYVNWFSGEPNDVFPGEDCVEVHAGGYGGWNDLNCNSWLPGVCMRAKGTVGNRLTFPKDNGSACGGVLLGSGIIRSPNFPEGYPDNANCLWTLRSGSATGWISLDIWSLSTEPCCDFLKIFDIAGKQLRLSGKHVHQRIIFRSPASIVFTSDVSANRNGFEIAFNATSILPDRSSCPFARCLLNGFVGNDCRCWCTPGGNETAAVLCPECRDISHRFCQSVRSMGFCEKQFFRSSTQRDCPRTCGYCL